MTVYNRFDLIHHNTFGLPVIAKEYIVVDKHTDYTALAAYLDNKTPIILGGGSNFLFVKNEVERILQYEGSSITIIAEDYNTITIRVEAGKNWHELVIESLDNAWYGLENLSLIPGTVGAAPIQNIGAYGIEVSSLIQSVHCIDIFSANTLVFTNEQCAFDYRSSIFKTHFKNQYLITSVDFILKKQPSVSIDYPDVKRELEGNNIINPTPIDVSRSIISIRNSKLPDPAFIGNAGSFFKNPILPNDTVLALKEQYPLLPIYPINDTETKVSAAWLIDYCGWKGKVINGAGVHHNQALVLINHSNANGRSIKELSELIQESVLSTFGIYLIPEVNIVE